MERRQKEREDEIWRGRVMRGKTMRYGEKTEGEREDEIWREERSGDGK